MNRPMQEAGGRPGLLERVTGDWAGLAERIRAAARAATAIHLAEIRKASQTHGSPAETGGPSFLRAEDAA